MEQISREKLQELDHLFRKSVRKFVKERDKISIEGISLPGLMILRRVMSSGEQRLSDLAEEMDLTSGAITAQCDKLEEQGLAERVRYKEDRRAIYLRITDLGQAFIERHHHIGHIHADVLFHGFSAQELEHQLHFYKRLIENLQGMSEKILAVAKLESSAVIDARQTDEQVERQKAKAEPAQQQAEQTQQQVEQTHQQAEQTHQQAEQTQQQVEQTHQQAEQAHQQAEQTQQQVEQTQQQAEQTQQQVEQTQQQAEQTHQQAEQTQLAQQAKRQQGGSLLSY